MKRQLTLWSLLITLVLVLGLVAGCSFFQGPLGGGQERTSIIDVNGDGIQTWNGGDIGAYSNAGTTKTWGVDGATGGVLESTQSSVTVTADSTIAVTGQIVPLTAAGAVGTATVTGCNTAGKVTIFRNTSANTITITDTGTLMLSGNAALGQYDTLMTVGDGTNCIEVAQTDN